MLKFVVVVRRKSGWTYEGFRDYFVRVHGQLAVKIPGLRRYKQNFPAPDPKRKEPAWDCVVELYFDDKDAMEAAWGRRKAKPLRLTWKFSQIWGRRRGQ